MMKHICVNLSHFAKKGLNLRTIFALFKAESTSMIALPFFHTGVSESAAAEVVVAVLAVGGACGALASGGGVDARDEEAEEKLNAPRSTPGASLSSCSTDLV